MQARVCVRARNPKHKTRQKQGLSRVSGDDKYIALALVLHLWPPPSLSLNPYSSPPVSLFIRKGGQYIYVREELLFTQHQSENKERVEGTEILMMRHTR